MKLLLDENLSDRIVYKIIDLYPGSEHVKTLSLRFTWLYPLLANQFGQLNYQIISPLVVKLSPIQSPNIEIKTRGKFRYRYISPINPGEPTGRINSRICQLCVDD